MKPSNFSPFEEPAFQQEDQALFHSAEHELAAFAGAVAHLFGPSQVRQAAIDWLDELDSIEALPRTGAGCDWRVVTAAAAARLAARLCGDRSMQALYRAVASHRLLGDHLNAA
jgi:plasmid stabilization system protein ParE